MLTKPIIAALFIGSVCSQAVTEPGDFVIGLVLPIHDTNNSIVNPYDIRYACGDLNYEQVIRVSTFRRMIAAANADQKLLPGFKIGYSIIDSCNVPNTALAYASVWTDAKNRRDRSNGNWVTLAVGAYSSRVSEPLASYLALYDIPLIDFAATSTYLSDRLQYPLYLRTTASDVYQAQALVDTAKEFGFACVHLIFSKGIYGEGGADEIRKSLAAKGICVASDQKAPLYLGQQTSDFNFDNIVSNLYDSPSTSGVICFCEDTTLVGLLMALQYRKSQTNETKFMLMASDYWGDSFKPTNLEDVAAPAVTVGLFSGGPAVNNATRIAEQDMSWYVNQVRNRSSADPWFSEYLEQRYRCSFHNRDDKREICNVEEMVGTRAQDLRQDASISYQFRLAVEAAIYGLNDMVKARCPRSWTKAQCADFINSNTGQLHPFIRNVSFTPTNGTVPFRFDENGEGNADYELFNYRRRGFGPFFLNRYLYKPLGTWSRGRGVALTRVRQDVDNAKMWTVAGRNTTITSTCQCLVQGGQTPKK